MIEGYDIGYMEQQIEELKNEIATRNERIALLLSENERLKGIILGNQMEVDELKKENEGLKDYGSEGLLIGIKTFPM